MEQQILEKLAEQEKKIDAIYVSVERTRKYFLWTLIITIAIFVLPLIGIAAILPWFLNVLTAGYVL